MRLRKREIKIIQIIKEHPYVTSREIADYHWHLIKHVEKERHFLYNVIKLSKFLNL